jgi:tetratricopeptide (TPR) repeat protein
MLTAKEVDMSTMILVIALLLGLGQGGAPAAERFDMVVRADFFAGFAGDQARLQKGMQTCEQMLAKNPRHAEALVWHGSGLVFQAGQAFAAGDMARGGALWGRGLQEMDDAVAMEPENVGVLIPQGATLFQASANVGGEAGTSLLEKAVADYEKVLVIQAPYFNTLGDHPRGELLFGLAEGYARLGKPDLARRYFDRLVNEAPASGQAPRARAWLETGTIPKTSGLGCVGCHK